MYTHCNPHAPKLDRTTHRPDIFIDEAQQGSYVGVPRNARIETEADGCHGTQEECAAVVTWGNIATVGGESTEPARSVASMIVFSRVTELRGAHIVFVLDDGFGSNVCRHG